VTLEQLRSVVPETEIYTPNAAEAPKSPGMKHRHYSPRARVVVSRESGVTSPKSAYIGLSKPRNGFELIKICGSVEEYAHSVFEFFRECDRSGIHTIYCEAMEEKGIGAALMDRLRRAAE
jgi:L-threonylcarbamoyladenylate synthase